MNLTNEEKQIIEEALSILVEMQDEADDVFVDSKKARAIDDLWNKVVNS